MTDKQMAEKKSEFLKRFVDVFEYEEGWNDGVSFRITASINEVWDFIEKLIEEVEESLVQEFEDCISEEPLIDVEKFLDLKDTVESKWD